MSLGARTIERYPGGVWWVELAAVPTTIYDDVVRGVTSRRLRGAGRVTFRRAPTLLVLDNSEHVAVASALSLRSSSTPSADPSHRDEPGAPRDVRGDGVAGPLAPVPPHGATWHRLSSTRRSGCSPSASCRRPRLRARRRQRVVGGAICARLDGIPLAVELAAGRCRQLGPVRVAKIDHRFELLTQAPRNEHRRHQTLSASIDWSHDFSMAGTASSFGGSACLPARSRSTSPVTSWSRSARSPARRNRPVGHCRLSLVDSIRGRRGPRRFRLLETLRMYAPTGGRRR